MERKILVLGATSAIAQAFTRRYVSRGDRVYLVGRNASSLEATEADLRVRTGATLFTEQVDLNDLARHESLIRSARRALGGLDLVLVAHGELGDPNAASTDPSAAVRVLQTNFISAVSLLTLAARELESHGSGVIVAISSVAGDRGRQSNYVYGAAKGGLSIFLQGLRNRLHKKGVSVVTIKPGLVDTPMTRDFRKGPLWASPDRVARGIVRAVNRRSDVAYVPRFWRIVMLILRALPESVFKRLSL